MEVRVDPNNRNNINVNIRDGPAYSNEDEKMNYKEAQKSIGIQSNYDPNVETPMADNGEGDKNPSVEDRLESNHIESFSHYAETTGFKEELFKLFKSLGSHEASERLVDHMLDIIWKIPSDQHQKNSLLNSVKSFTEGSSIRSSAISHNISWILREAMKTKPDLKDSIRNLFKDIINSGESNYSGINEIGPPLREVYYFLSTNGQNGELAECLIEAVADAVSRQTLPPDALNKILAGEMNSPAFKSGVTIFNNGAGQNIGLKVMNGGKLVSSL